MVQEGADAYGKDFTPGKKLLRTWMFKWTLMAGNKGYQEFEKFGNLIVLILKAGFITHPDERPGRVFSFCFCFISNVSAHVMAS
jgi:hypothetical protein